MKVNNLRKWRQIVLEKDNYTCQECGNTEEKLQAHHIKPKCSHPELKLEIENGKTLCRNCHENLNRQEQLMLRKTIADKRSQI